MDTLYKEGVQLTHQRKYELARAKFLEAIALDGDDAEAVLSLSVVETDLGHPVAAYVALRRYLRHPKADPATAAKARARMVPALEAKVGQIAVTASPGMEATVEGRQPCRGGAPALRRDPLSRTRRAARRSPPV